MGIHIDKGNLNFRQIRNSAYIDKSGLISVVNKTLFTEQRRSCVTRCRRFGKSIAANMLYAYYDRSCDSRALFEDLEIAKDPSFEQYLNKFPVIKLDVTDFTTRFKDVSIVAEMEKELKADIQERYQDVVPEDFEGDLMAMLIRINQQTDDSFVMIIDEWDAICREFDPDSKVMDAYVDWLRRMFKGDNTLSVFAGVYMTGILPIKKYKTESALNNFIEYSVLSPRRAAKFFGFTKADVMSLCEECDMDYDEMEKWYDGYCIGKEMSMFNPNSVINAIDAGECTSYWARTGAYDKVADYISMNFEGLRDDIIYMLAGGSCPVCVTRFSNDIHDVRSKDDVLTVLIHLGYLAYNPEEEECYIPNREVRMEMEHAVEDCKWRIADTIASSRKLLKATLNEDAAAVAAAIEKAHDSNTSILSYNDENSLACVLTIAYIYAQNDYIFHRELATGKGFADIVLIPRKNVDSPAIILELKYNKDADAAIDQIKRKNYPAKVAEYLDTRPSGQEKSVLLVGINYDKQGPEGKQHTCKLERVQL